MSNTPTPYDTGARCEPKPWQHDRRDVSAALAAGSGDDVGKVDFDDDEGCTVATVYVSRGPSGNHLIHIQANPTTTEVALLP